MNPQREPHGPLMTRLRLAEIVAGVDRQGPREAEVLLFALMSAAWPTSSARDH